MNSFFSLVFHLFLMNIRMCITIFNRVAVTGTVAVDIKKRASKKYVLRNEEQWVYLLFVLLLFIASCCNWIEICSVAHWLDGFAFATKSTAISRSKNKNVWPFRHPTLRSMIFFLFLSHSFVSAHLTNNILIQLSCSFSTFAWLAESMEMKTNYIHSNRTALD